MDRKLARKNIRSGLIAGAICAFMFGITMVVIGTTINWLISIGGGIVLIITIAMWIRDTRRDVAALPEEHH